MENKFVKISENADWSEYTFILACVSVGNIGQLATDLLISSLPGTKKSGYLISTLIEPLTGYNNLEKKSVELNLSCDCKCFNISFLDLLDMIVGVLKL